MRKFLQQFSVFMALVCLLSGCSNSGSTGQDDTASDDLSIEFENNSDTHEVGSVDFGFPDPMDTIYTYTGKPLKIPFYITGTAEDTKSEVGVLLFVNGIAQPYTAVYEDGTELKATYMQTFALDSGKKDTFTMSFQPVTGKSGDNLSVIAVTILKPSYLPESAENPSYGNYHADSATIARHISFEADCAAQELVVQTTEYEITDIPKEEIDRLTAWSGLDALDTTVQLSLVTDQDKIIHGDGKTATVTVNLYGGQEANFNITLFVNHQPVQLNEADYLAIHTEKNKMATATFTIDTSSLGELNTIYAVAAASGDDDKLEINNPIKSTSILLVNKEG